MFKLLGFLFWSIMCFAGGSIVTLYGAYSIMFDNGIDGYNPTNTVINSVISRVIPSDVITRTTYSTNNIIPVSMPVNDTVTIDKNNITDEQFNQYIVQQAMIQNNMMDKQSPSILDFTDRELYNYFLAKEVEMFNNSHDFKHHR